jgi:chromosome segregation ATPase
MKFESSEADDFAHFRMKLERRIDIVRANESDLQKQHLMNASLANQLEMYKEQVTVIERALHIKDDDINALRAQYNRKIEHERKLEQQLSDHRF